MTRAVRAYPILSPRDDKERFKLLKATAAQLSEHYDSVVIVATKTTGGVTSRFDWGAGNRYAMIASVQEVVEAMSAGDAAPGEDDDDD